MSLLGIDVGTSVCKAGAFSTDGTCYGIASEAYDPLSPEPGCFELDAEKVWGKVKPVIRQAVEMADEDKVQAISVCSMGEAMVRIAGGRPVGRSILGHDARGGEYVEQLSSKFTQEQFYDINPNIIGINYSLPKLKWIQHHQRELFDATELFLPWADTVLHLLGADPACCNSLANRTLLLDLDQNDWSDELLSATELPREKLARVVSGGSVVGEVSADIAEELGLPEGAVLVAGSHDQCCNALGAGGIEGGMAVCGIGTYESLTPIFQGVPDKGEMLRTGLNIEHHVLPDLYVAFIYNHAGLLTDWFRKSHHADFQELEAEMPASPTALLTLPYFEPTGAPYFISDAAGAVLGLRSTTTRGELYKSLLEAIALYAVESLQSLSRLGFNLDEVIATGGGSRSDAWLQIHADIWGVPISRLASAETGVTGAAMLAGLSTGVYPAPKEACEVFVRHEKTFEPDKGRHEAYAEMHALYQQVYPSTKDLLNKLA